MDSELVFVFTDKINQTIADVDAFYNPNSSETSIKVNDTLRPVDSAGFVILGEIYQDKLCLVGIDLCDNNTYFVAVNNLIPVWLNTFNISNIGGLVGMNNI